MIRATRFDAYRLMHEGTLALAEVEAAGIRVDEARLTSTINHVQQEIDKLTHALMNTNEWKIWCKLYGDKARLTSRVQLGSVLSAMGFQLPKTETGRLRTDEDSLRELNTSFVDRFLQLEKLRKLKSTYLVGILREVQDGYVHPCFSLNLVRSYRSSSDHPNFQNVPVRSKDISKLIRTCFIPRQGRLLVEIDYKALEVHISAVYHQDPVLIEYLTDPERDMHRDLAMECFLLDRDNVTKEARFYAKNCFVFPQFYGSYWAQCAPNLWKVTQDVKTSCGISLREHLQSKGIRTYEQFERHIESVEHAFWGERFRVYAKWKRDWYEEYCHNGYFDMLTGFRVEGVYERNDVINYPIQGTAFHCLLWSLIQLLKWLRKNRMQTLIVGQIHDSILADVVPSELNDYLAAAKRIMTVDIKEHWKWLNVPLAVEAEASDKTWFDKQPIEIA